MATPIVDLDELLGEEKKVRLRGRTFTLPPDLPVETYLKITRAAEQKLSDVELVELLYSELLELFRYGDQSIQELPLGMAQLLEVIPTIYSAGGQEERPTRTKTRGGSSTPRTPRSATPKR